jgi:acetyl/propionyl-CoA carboxylase alpha subunit
MTTRRVRVGAVELEATARLQGGRLTLEGPQPCAWEVRLLRGPEWVLVGPDGVECLLVVRDASGWWVHHRGRTWRLGLSQAATSRAPEDHGSLIAPMPGKVLEVLVHEGEEVRAGAPLVVLSAMKMRIELKSPIAGVVTRLPHAVGDQVDAGVPLAHVDAPAPGDPTAAP